MEENEEFITMHPGTSKAERSWQAERFGILCQKIFKKDKKKIILLGTQSEKELLNRIKNYCPPGEVKIVPSMNLRVLAGLIKKKLVDRRPDDKDRRNSILNLTNKGWAIYDQIAPEAAAFEERLKGALNEKEATEFNSILSKLMDKAAQI